MSKRAKYQEEPISEFALNAIWKSKTTWNKLGYKPVSKSVVTLSFRSPQGTKDYEAYHAYQVKLKPSVWKSLCETAKLPPTKKYEYADIAMLIDKLLDIGREDLVNNTLKYALVTKKEFDADLKVHKKWLKEKEENPVEWERKEKEKRKEQWQRWKEKKPQRDREKARNLAADFAELAYKGTTVYLCRLPKEVIENNTPETIIEILKERKIFLKENETLSIKNTKIRKIVHTFKGKTEKEWLEIADSETLSEEKIKEILDLEMWFWQNRGYYG